MKELQTEIHNRRGNSGKIRLMFQDEAGFGRINKPKYCWCEKGTRPSVPCHHIREYRYAYGAVEPLTGESCFLIMPYCNTVCMNLFLRARQKILCKRRQAVVKETGANQRISLAGHNPA